MVVPHEISFCHYFDKPVDLIFYVDVLTKISERFGMERKFYWKKTLWCFYHEFIVKNAKSNYCIKFYSLRKESDINLAW